MSEKLLDMFCRPVYERALLSFSMNSMKDFYTVSSSISAHDFLRLEHKLIWIILGTLAKRGVPKFDAEMIVHEAVNDGVSNDIGGYSYVVSIMNMDLGEENIDYYIRHALDASAKHKLHVQLEKDIKAVEKSAGSDDIAASEMLGMVSKNVLDLSMKSKAVKEATNLADGLREYIEERKNNPVEYCGISTGYPILDKRIDGLVPKTLTVVCARPKEGKSTFLSNIGAHVAFELKLPVLYVDTEMDFDQWRNRILSNLSGVPERRIKHGGYSDQEYYNIQQAAAVIEEGKFFHEYMPGYSIDKLIAVYNKYKYVEDIGLAIFDYIKEPSTTGKDARKEYQLLGDVTTVLKDLAGELGIPFLCATQVNRQQDIADSDRILRYADVLSFFKQREKEEVDATGNDGGNFKLVITNSRRGGTTPVEGIGFVFLKRMLKISEAPVQMIDYDSKEYKEKEDMEYDVAEPANNTSEPTEL